MAAARLPGVADVYGARPLVFACATERRRDGTEGSGPAVASFEATRRDQDGTSRPLGDGEIVVDGDGRVAVSLSALADGKYRVTVRGSAQNGRAREAIRLVFWVEEEPFSWEDALIYMVVTDRFRDGDPGANPPPTSGADPRGEVRGGDLVGLRRAIAEGTLDALGVRALWLAPFQTNAAGAYLASDGVHRVTGYHGDWPIRACEMAPWIDGEEARRALMAEAHRHGSRAATVRETFDPAGARYFMMGETAMGWNDCPDPCNDESYGTISRYIGPHGEEAAARAPARRVRQPDSHGGHVGVRQTHRPWPSRRRRADAGLDGATLNVELSASLGFVPGTALRNALGGAGVVIPPSGAPTLTVPAKGARILHP